jgi:hypothetical protein
MDSTNAGCDVNPDAGPSFGPPEGTERPTIRTEKAHSANGRDIRGETVTNEAGPEADDPFSPERLRLSQDFGAAAGVRKLLTTVPVRKPSREWFVRTHPDEAYRLQTAVLELKEDREVYLVDRPLWAALATEATFSPRLLVVAINRQGVLFVWPVRLPGPDGKIDDWSRSALEAVNLARESWVRVSANMSLGAYDLAVASHQTAPEWPDLSMGEILKVAFRDRFIRDPDHPVLRRLRGEG